MVIYSTEQVSPEVIKITSDTGLAFFIRTTFLKIVSPAAIEKDAEFSEEEEDDIIDAGMTYSAECKAVEYLARAEQCRFNLAQKLLKKNYLNDGRFARAWLNSRKINHYEGRKRLLAELLSRGISKEDSCEALDEFFAENPEEALCEKAYHKYVRAGKSEEALIRSMTGAGFSYQLIKRTIRNAENEGLPESN